MAAATESSAAGPGAPAAGSSYAAGRMRRETGGTTASPPTPACCSDGPASPISASSTASPGLRKHAAGGRGGTNRGGNHHVGDPAQQWGAPDVNDDLKLFASSANVFPNGVQAYGRANYARRDGLTFFYYRTPTPAAACFSNDAGRTLFVGDVLAARGEGWADYPTVAIEDNVPDPAALEEVFAAPHCFSFQELFSGGFAPRFGRRGRSGGRSCCGRIVPVMLSSSDPIGRQVSEGR